MNSTNLAQQTLVYIDNTEELQRRFESALILDATAGNRSMWFDRKHKRTIYIDQREEVNPDIVCDNRKLDFPDKKFKLVVFDPPHLQWLGQTSVFRRKYGALNKETWPDDIKRAAYELWRVLDDFGVLIFKWADHDIPYESVLKLFPEKPLFGQITAANQRSKDGSKPYHTYWFCFLKIPGGSD